ncbi:MAG: AIPR family protein [Ferruginibacter sp.]
MSLELNKFYSALMQDVSAAQSTDDEGAISEQIFTQYAVDLLAAAGESENVVVKYDEKGLGTPKQHKINAYAISENYETVDLFITIFNGTDEISKISNGDIETASKRILNFFRKAIYSIENEKSSYFKNDYVDEIEESSEIFQFAYTLAKSHDIKENLVRVNAFILTNGTYKGDFPANTLISGYNFYYKIFDVESLYNITEKSHIPIEINFKADGFIVPCIPSPSINNEYQSYLAIIPGEALASIYERFGARLLEQNVRSFLQFNGKINKGIRTTIMKEPEMFLAFNNGIAATADEIELETSKDGSGKTISVVRDLQIVNGGQTTASIYHTQKKDKADISNIFVQVKLSVVKNKEKFSEIVSRISEYANTQNKVSVSDLSSNRPYHIELEKLSRNIFTPITDGKPIQTKWFYERARGQYKNAILKDGFNPSRKRAFDLKTPKQQLFTKEELAKYINAYQEIADGKKILVGPHYVVRGNQKNYVQFVNFNLSKKLDSIYFEDSIAKAILFRAAEKIYGAKPNAIGDMRSMTVPYSLTLLNHLTKNQLDLYKIWKAQEISPSLKDLLGTIMTGVESFIKKIGPGGRYEEYAKKEECWLQVKDNDFEFDLSTIKRDLIDKKNLPKRAIISDDESDSQKRKEDLETIKSIPTAIWKKIEEWGRETKNLSDNQQSIAWNLALKVRNNSSILANEISNGIAIIDKVVANAPEMLSAIEEMVDTLPSHADGTEITIELVKKIIQWDKKNKRLKAFEYIFMTELLGGEKSFTEQNKKIASMNLAKVKKYGFNEG